MGHLSRLFILLCALALLVPAAASAAGPWGTPRTVDVAGGGERLGEAAIGLDDRGGPLGVWTRGNARRARIVAARGTPRLGFGPAETLRAQRRAIDSPVVDFDGRTGVIAYRRSIRGVMRIEARSVSGRGTLGPVQILSGSGGSAFLPDFVDPVTAGRPVLWWLRGTASRPSIQLSRARAAGRFTRTVRYAIPGATADVDLAAAPDGSTYAAVTRRDPANGRLRVYVARQAAGSSAISIAPLSDGARFPREPQVVVTRTGTAVVAWTESLGQSEELMVTERGTDGAFAPPRAVAGGEYMASLKVVASSQDVVLAGWVGAATGTPARQSTGRLRMTRLGEAGARFPITTTQQSVEGFALDADGRGGITAAFIGQRGRLEGGPLYAVAIGADGQYGAARQLTARGERAVTASLATGERGDVAAMWVTAGGRAVRFARRAR